MLSVRAGERKDFSVEKVLILSSFYPPLPRVLAGVISEWTCGLLGVALLTGTGQEHCVVCTVLESLSAGGWWL